MATVYLTLTNFHAVCVYDTLEEVVAYLNVGPLQTARTLRTGVLIRDCHDIISINKVIKGAGPQEAKQCLFEGALVINNDPVENRNALLEELYKAKLSPITLIPTTIPADTNTYMPKGLCPHPYWFQRTAHIRTCAGCHHHLDCQPIDVKTFEEAVTIYNSRPAGAPSPYAGKHFPVLGDLVNTHLEQIRAEFTTELLAEIDVRLKFSRFPNPLYIIEHMEGKGVCVTCCRHPCHVVNTLDLKTLWNYPVNIREWPITSTDHYSVPPATIVLDILRAHVVKPTLPLPT